MDQAIKIPLHNRAGEVVGHTLVDVDAAPLVASYRWYREVRSCTDIVYAVRRFKDGDRLRRMTVHNLVLGVDDIIDHRDGDGLNNCRSNLRPATHAQNMQNRRKHKNGRSQFRGVYWDAKCAKWRAEARLSGQKHHLGMFASEEEAGRVASEWRARHMPFSVERSA